MAPDAPPEQPVRLRLSPLAYLFAIVAGVLLVSVVALLIAQVVILKDSQSHIQAQDHKIATLQGQANEIARDARPAIDEAQPLLQRAQRLFAPTEAALDDVSGVARDVPRIVMGADLLLSEAIPLIQALNANDAPGALASVHGLVHALVATDRLVRTVDSANALLADLHDTRFIPRASAAIPRFEGLIVTLAQIQRRTLAVQRQTLRVQRRTFRLFQQSVEIQRETLEHTRSIDRKTGPTPPQTPVTPAAPSP
jgi:hypothetical protein